MDINIVSCLIVKHEELIQQLNVNSDSCHVTTFNFTLDLLLIRLMVNKCLYNCIIGMIGKIN